MKMDEIISIGVEIEINENIGFIKDVVNKLGKMPWDTAKKFLKQKAKEFEAFVKDDPYVDDSNVLRIINNRFGTHFSDIHSVFAKGLVESTDRCDEGLKDWWKEASSSLYGALSFYPLLTAFLELDKVLKGTGDANIRVLVVYFLIWVLVVSGKVIAGKIAGPGQEKEAGATVNPKTWAEILNKARVNA